MCLLLQSLSIFGFAVSYEQVTFAPEGCGEVGIKGYGLIQESNGLVYSARPEFGVETVLRKRLLPQREAEPLLPGVETSTGPPRRLDDRGEPAVAPSHDALEE